MSKLLWTLAVLTLMTCLEESQAESVIKVGNPKWKGPGTTPNLKNIIVGRCYHYMSLNPDIGEKKCNEIWQELTEAVFKKNPCNINEADYEKLAQMAEQTIPCDKTLLWSRTNKLVHYYTKASNQFLTLEDTFLGFLFNGLTWCGRPATPGFSFRSCPAWNECENNTLTAFWKMASATFTRSSCGVINVMLNGSVSGEIARRESIFRTVEVPSMNPKQVSEVKLWIIDDIQGEDKNSCNSESVLELKHYIGGHNLKYSCIDNYRLGLCREPRSAVESPILQIDSLWFICSSSLLQILLDRRQDPIDRSDSQLSSPSFLRNLTWNTLSKRLNFSRFLFSFFLAHLLLRIT